MTYRYIEQCGDTRKYRMTTETANELIGCFQNEKPWDGHLIKEIRFEYRGDGETVIAYVTRFPK